jgi:hypothetical protein
MLKIAVVAFLLVMMLLVYRYGRSRYDRVRRRREEILERMRKRHDSDA